MYIILLILAIFPFIYKMGFWLYTIQLKEYRWDRFREYINTYQGKKAIQNFWLVFEIPLIFLGFLVLFNSRLYEGIVTFIMFYFLIFQNIFVLGKFFRKRLLLPKLTSRIFLLILFSLFGIILDILFIVKNYPLFAYSYIFIILVTVPLLIFVTNLFTLPIVNYKKNKLISRAIKKSKIIKNPIKIGVTGSYGKTSIKEYLAQILDQVDPTLKTPENINTELGVSSIVLNKLNNKYKYFIAEIGAYKIGEIETMGKIVNHKYGFLSAIGNQHLGLFGGIENTKKAKFEIIKSIVKNNGKLYINYDNENIFDYIKQNNFKNILGGKKIDDFVVTYGIDRYTNQAKSKITSLNNGITNFKLTYKDKEYNFYTKLLGKHNIINLTGIIAFCLDMQIPYTRLKNLIKVIKAPKNTLTISKTKHNNIELTQIDDSYNLSQEGLYSGIEVLNSFKNDENKTQNILVIDDILELGKKSKIIHYEVGKYLAKNKKIDKILLCGVNYKDELVNGLLKGGFLEKNIINSLENLEKNSIILFEGRGSGKYIKN